MKRVNLIPSDFSKDIFVKRKNLLLLGKGLVILIVVVILWQLSAIFRYQKLIARKKSEIKIWQKNLDEAQRKKEILDFQLDDISKGKVKVQKIISALKKSRQQGVVWSKVLLSLEELSPENVRLSMISLTQDQVLIGGSSSLKTNISDFMDSLDTSPLFHQTGFNFIKREEQEDVEKINFEITSSIVKDKLMLNP